MEVRIEVVPVMRVAYVRNVGPYLTAGSAWSKLFAWAGPRGLAGGKMIGMGHDDPECTPADQLRYDACITVGDSVQADGEVGIQEIGGGEYAVGTHVGPYESLGHTYARLYGEWLPHSGREPRASPPFEVYLNSPMNTAPSELRTDIYLPLAAK